MQPGQMICTWIFSLQYRKASLPSSFRPGARPGAEPEGPRSKNCRFFEAWRLLPSRHPWMAQNPFTKRRYEHPQPAAAGGRHP